MVQKKIRKERKKMLWFVTVKSTSTDPHIVATKYMWLVSFWSMASPKLRCSMGLRYTPDLK